MIIVLLAAALAQEKVEDTPQVTALRTLQRRMKDKDWAKIHAEAHPDLREQLGVDKFAAYMQGVKGGPIVEIVDEVLKAVDGKAGPDVLLAEFQSGETKTDYHFVLVKVKAQPARQGRQWHLELKLDAGVWRFLDTD